MTISASARARLIAMALFICLGCLGSLHAQTSPGAPQTSSSCRLIKQIPLEPYGGLFLLRVRINDQAEPVKLLLDSACSETYLFTDQADKFGLKREGQATRQGVGDNAYQINFAKDVSLDISGLKLTEMTLVVTQKSLPYCDGLIGYDLFSRFVVEMDFQALNIKVYEPGCEIKASADAVIPLTFLQSDLHIPTVRASLTMPARDPIEGIFSVDTGAGLSAYLNRPFVERHQLLESKQRFLSVKTGGLSGGSNAKIGRLKSFQLGRFSFSGPIIGFFQAQKGSGSSAERDGVIGNELLRRFKVTFDYPHRRMILEPNVHLADPFEYTMTGLRFTSHGKNWKITSVLDDSPGSQAGLQVGDVLTAIDGQPTEKISVDQFNNLLEQEGRTYVFEIERGDETKRLSITLKRVI